MSPLRLRSSCLLSLALLFVVSITGVGQNQPTDATPNYYYQQGETLYATKKYREALPYYTKAAQLNPSMTLALYRIGWIYNDLAEYNAALDPLKRVVLLQPNYAAAFFELGFAYKNLNRFTEALAAFKETVRHKPDYSGAHYHMGWIYNEQENYNYAFTSLKLALQASE